MPTSLQGNDGARRWKVRPSFYADSRGIADGASIGKSMFLNHDGSRKCEVEMAREEGRACAKLSTVSGESVVFAYELARQ